MHLVKINQRNSLNNDKMTNHINSNECFRYELIDGKSGVVELRHEGAWPRLAVTNFKLSYLENGKRFRFEILMVHLL